MPGRDVLREEPVLTSLLSRPIHLLRFVRSSCFSSSGLSLHYWSGDTFKVFRGLTALTDITTIEATLLQLACRLTFHETVMLVSEFLGTFSILELPENWWAKIPSYRQGRALVLPDGWKVVCTREGRPTGLLQRAPLITKDELLHFADMNNTLRGSHCLLDAVCHAVEGAASPFEVQAAMALGLPRTRGGAGYTDLQINARIDLDERARVIAGRAYCIADILIERDERSVVVECQSSLIHNEEGSYLRDGTRTTALQSMGYVVVLLTIDQLKDERSFARIVSMIDGVLGVRRRPAGSRICTAREQLRKVLFQRWAGLGSSE